MKRNRFRRFFQQKQYAVASLILFAAIAAMTGVYFSDKITSERQEEEMAQPNYPIRSKISRELPYKTAQKIRYKKADRRRARQRMMPKALLLS